jgi:anaerobic selenocysteine-containing dehydrogenase
VDAVREIVNVPLLRGNIGREWAGPCPVRGHSNVQGNRTCGINHRPEPQFLDRLAEVCHIDPPREHGLDGFEDFNERIRHPHGFRISQPARERGFLTPSGRAEFSLAPLPGDVDPGPGRLMLTTVRSHDQFNTTIYSNDDRYRGLKGLRTVVFMNEGDMRDRGLDEFGLVDITSISRDGAGAPSTATAPSATTSRGPARRATCPN